MYDCSGSIIENNTALYLPNQNLVCTCDIDFQKYENWLRCIDVTRAAYLMAIFGFEQDQFYVKKFGEYGDSVYYIRLATIAAMPKFLSRRPQYIWCSFIGGPNQCQVVHASLLNFIVDRVYKHILLHGSEATDSKIIAALNHKQRLLLLKAPDSV